MINSTNVSQITTRHAVLYWSKIPDNNLTYGNIMGYKIYLFKIYHMEVSANNGSVMLPNLSPKTTYNVTVLGFNGYGDGVVSDTFTFRTMGNVLYCCCLMWNLFHNLYIIYIITCLKVVCNVSKI